MKKNFTKITTLILACLLLIGAAVGISVSAEDASVEIAYKNLAYEAAPQLVYYVDAQNVAEGETVKVLFYDAEPAEVTVAGASYVAESFGTLTVGETEYEELDMFLWGITHFGTGWDYVLTDLKIVEGWK